MATGPAPHPWTPDKAPSQLGADDSPMDAALMQACWSADIQTIGALLSTGHPFDLNTPRIPKDQHGFSESSPLTPIGALCSKTTAKMSNATDASALCAKMFSLGASFEARQGDGPTSFEFFCSLRNFQYGHERSGLEWLEGCPQLAGDAPRNARFALGGKLCGALAWMLHSDRVDEAEFLLANAGFQAFGLDEHGRNPLSYATSAKAVAMLARHGAKADERCSDGKSPLHWMLDIHGDSRKQECLDAARELLGGEQAKHPLPKAKPARPGPQGIDMELALANIPQTARRGSKSELAKAISKAGMAKILFDGSGESKRLLAKTAEMALIGARIASAKWLILDKGADPMMEVDGSCAAARLLGLGSPESSISDRWAVNSIVQACQPKFDWSMAFSDGKSLALKAAQCAGERRPEWQYRSGKKAGWLEQSLLAAIANGASPTVVGPDGQGLPQAYLEGIAACGRTPDNVEAPGGVPPGFFHICLLADQVHPQGRQIDKAVFDKARELPNGGTSGRAAAEWLGSFLKDRLEDLSRLPPDSWTSTAQWIVRNPAFAAALFKAAPTLERVEALRSQIERSAMSIDTPSPPQASSPRKSL